MKIYGQLGMALGVAVISGLVLWIYSPEEIEIQIQIEQLPLNLPATEMPFSGEGLISYESLNLTVDEVLGPVYFISVRESFDRANFQPTMMLLDEALYEYRVLETFERTNSKMFVLAAGEFASREEAQLALTDLNSLLDIDGVLKKMPEIELQSLSFMNLPDDPELICREGTQLWQVENLHQVISIYSEYLNFMQINGIADNRESRDVISTIAYRKVNRVANNLLNESQQNTESGFIASTSSVLRPIGDRESKIARESQLFRQSADSLLQIFAIFRQLDMTQTFGALHSCTGRYAIGVLDRIARLVEDSELYTRVPSSFRGATEFSSYQAEISGVEDLRGYLQVQHERTSVLFQYVKPFVVYLMNSDFPDEENSEEEQSVVSYWFNSLREYENFSQGKDVNSQVQRLDDYMAYLLIDIDIHNCTEADLVVQAHYGNELFSSVRSKLDSALLSVCQEH